jgi:hypothetical protein
MAAQAVEAFELGLYILLLAGDRLGRFGFAPKIGFCGLFQQFGVAGV